MKSIYQQVLGCDFAKLHPQIQKRFGLTSETGLAAIGTGVMERVWHGAFYTLPFLALGTYRNVMFPESGTNVPFTIQNYAYRDSYDRETVTWLRKFETAPNRRFDAYMIHSPQRNRIIDYLGTHQHLAVDIDLTVDQTGGLRLRSGEQRFYERALGFRFPMLFSGIADVCEWYDESIDQFRIEVQVANRLWGPLFGYRGTFKVEWQPMTEIPEGIRPQREERRE